MRELKTILKNAPIIIMMAGLALVLPCIADAQSKPSAPTGPVKTSREMQKKQWKKQRKIDLATKKALKVHMKHQTKEVRKRMKKDAKKASDNNSR
jgi:hypothetical protein